MILHLKSFIIMIDQDADSSTKKKDSFFIKKKTFHLNKPNL